MKKNLLLVSVVVTNLFILLAACRDNNSSQNGNDVSILQDKKEPNSQPISNTESKVVINGITWDEKMKLEFENTYRMKPIPGEYWYDPNCGLWGKMGGPALSFIYPGHNYGKLESNVSNGNTGIFINGREIPLEEAYIWSLVMGTPAQQGRYWLNNQGYVGYEGYAVPLFNLFALAKRNSYQAKGGSDNFWSSTLARGNEEGGFGYVSIPGSGITVTYGN